MDHYPIEGIRDIGSFFKPVWQKKVGTINGKKLSLGEIEHEILRPLAEPRIHFALVCASLSCPNLRPTLYTGENLSAELEDQTRIFLQDSSKRACSSETNSFGFRKYFKWFEEDFEQTGGVLSFIHRYQTVPSELKSFKTLNYNWSVNDRPLE